MNANKWNDYFSHAVLNKIFEKRIVMPNSALGTLNTVWSRSHIWQIIQVQYSGVPDEMKKISKGLRIVNF